MQCLSSFSALPLSLIEPMVEILDHHEIHRHIAGSGVWPLRRGLLHVGQSPPQVLDLALPCPRFLSPLVLLALHLAAQFILVGAQLLLIGLTLFEHAEDVPLHVFDFSLVLLVPRGDGFLHLLLHLEELVLEAPPQSLDLGLDFGPGRRLLKRLPLIHQLPLDVQNDSLLPGDEVVHNFGGGFSAPVVPKDLAPFLHHLGPKVRLGPELLFSVKSRLLIDPGRPHRRRQDDVGQPIIPAELLEHAEILHRRTTHPDVGDAMQIDNPGEQDSVLIGPLQPVGDLPEDIGVALVGIVESGGVDQEKPLVGIGDAFKDPHFARAWEKGE